MTRDWREKLFVLCRCLCVAAEQWNALDCDVEMSVWSLEMSNNALGGKTQDVRQLMPPTYGPKLSPFLVNVGK